LPRKLLLAFVSALLVAVVAECVARILLPAPPTVWTDRLDPPPARLGVVAAPDEERITTHPIHGQIFYNTADGLRLRPNHRVIIDRHDVGGRSGIVIQTNSIGYRNPEVGPRRARRILFLGDSITFADYLPADETFVRRIEALARADGRDWETINAGVGGVSLAAEIAILKETGLALAPDVVVLGWYLNDFQGSAAMPTSRLPPLLRRSRLIGALDAALARRRALQQRRRDGFATGLDLVELRNRFRQTHDLDASGDLRADNLPAFHFQVWRQFEDWGGSWAPEVWEHQEALLTELRRLADEHRFQLAIVAFPCAPQVEAGAPDDFPQQQLARIATSLNIPLYDTLPDLRAQWRQTGQPVFFDACHPTAPTNRFLAEKIDAFLQSLPDE
jgi:hypothetical protein